jgi:hypothetical protein
MQVLETFAVANTWQLHFADAGGEKKSELPCKKEKVLVSAAIWKIFKNVAILCKQGDSI